MRISVMVLGGALLLSACNPADPKAGGLSAEEQTALLDQVGARFFNRRYAESRTALYKTGECHGIFTVGAPELIDAMLSESTGKLRVVVPISVHTIPPKRHYLPTGDCYGFEGVQFNGSEPLRIPYEFNLEKWGSGWRLAQPQPGMELVAAPR